MQGLFLYARFQGKFNLYVRNVIIYLCVYVFVILIVFVCVFVYVFVILIVFVCVFFIYLFLWLCIFFFCDCSVVTHFAQNRKCVTIFLFIIYFMQQNLTRILVRFYICSNYYNICMYFMCMCVYVMLN